MSAENVKELLILIYLEIKIRKYDDLIDMTKFKIEIEKQKLMKTSILDIVKYIYDYIDILVEKKAEEKYQERIKLEKEMENNINNNSVKEYEKLLIKAEKDIRQHIKNELELKVRLEELEFLLNEIQNKKNEKNNLFSNYQNFPSLKKKINERNNKKIYINLVNKTEILSKIKINNLNNYSKKDNTAIKKLEINSLLARKNNIPHKNNILFDNCNSNENNQITQDNSIIKVRPLIISSVNKKYNKKIFRNKNYIYYSANKMPKINFFQSNIKKENNIKHKYFNSFQKNSNFSKVINRSKMNMSKLSCKLKLKKNLFNLELKKEKQKKFRYINQNKFNTYNSTHNNTNSSISNKIKNNSKTSDESKNNFYKTVRKKGTLTNITRAKFKTINRDQSLMKHTLVLDDMNHSLRNNRKLLYNSIIVDNPSTNNNLNNINRKKKKFDKKLLLRNFTKKNSGSINDTKNDNYSGMFIKKIDNRKAIKKMLV